MPMIPCAACGHTISDMATACPSCGHPSQHHIARQEERPSASNQPEHSLPVLTLLGALLLGVGPFLPWVTLGMLSANGMDKAGSEALVLSALGVLGGLVAIDSFANPKQYKGGVAVAAGALGLVLSMYYYFQISEQVANLDIGSPGIGVGIYLCLGGSVLLGIVGFYGLARSSQSRPSGPQASQKPPVQ